MLKYPCLVLDHDDTVVNSTAVIHFPSFQAYLDRVRPGVTYTLEEYFRKNFDPGIMPLFPFGAHLAVVEVDTESGKAVVDKIFTVDDAGTILNPLIAEGQRHGGIAQGIAQALYEEIVFDDEGQPLGRPPLAASGLKLQRRLAEVAASLDRVAAKRGSRRS